MKKKFIFKTKSLIIFILILLIIGIAVAELTDTTLIKETSKYKVTRTELDNKEALTFELKEIMGMEIIEEFIELKEDMKNKDEK